LFASGMFIALLTFLTAARIAGFGDAISSVFWSLCVAAAAADGVFCVLRGCCRVFGRLLAECVAYMEKVDRLGVCMVILLVCLGINQ
jgi:hypothetical protein